MFLRILSFVLLIFSFSTGSARAEEYANVSWANLLRTMVRFNALDLTDQNLVDDFAIVSECDMYKAFYGNDFKWNQVREAIRESASMNRSSYPANYHYDVTVRLDRYDFEAKIFRFEEKFSLRGINALSIYSVYGTACGKAKVQNIPRSFRAVLLSPIYLDGLPLPEGDAQALLARMKKDQNPNRVVFVRYNLRTAYIEPLRKMEDKTGMRGLSFYAQTTVGSTKEVRFDTQLDSIEFFEDQERTKLIYQFKP